MSDETAIVKTDVEGERLSTILIARNSMEMQQSQEQLSAWLDGKIRSLKADLREYVGHYEHAKAHKWRATGHAKAVANTKCNIIFYEKIKAAVDAGYAIMPDLPIRAFGLRVDRENTAPRDNSSYWKYDGKELSVSTDAKPLEIGKGEYVSESPDRRFSHNATDPKTNQSHSVYSNFDWKNVAFPLKAAKIELMEGASLAMQQKIFDEIGIFPRDRRPRDPMIVGRIIGKKASYCFVIAWYLDLQTL